ncbi:MAG: DEAD/DEAH box helicase [archaeon]
MVLSIIPREYQQKIFDTCKEKNTLVVLPTGLGKTLIAVLLAIERLKKYPLKKILFLAPTKPLVEQHYHYFKKNLPELFADIQLFTGEVKAEKRKEIWQTAEIILSTPQCIANDLDHMLYDLTNISLLIIDEAHRCLKNYDYTKIVSKYKNTASSQRILGLTASPGSDPAIIAEICTHLDIETIELRTRDSEDVVPYVQEIEFEKIEIPFPLEFVEIKILLKRIWDSKVEQLKNRHLLFAPANKITLLNLQKKLAAQASPSNFNALVGMSLTAQAIKISHAQELLETQTLSGLRAYLDGLIQQAKDKKTKGVQTLVNSAEFQAANLSLNTIMNKGMEHPKIQTVTDIITKQIAENPKSKSIVFSQFRETANVIAKSLNQIPGARAAIFIGQANKGKDNAGLSQKEQKEVIEKFKTGEINVLCSTSIGEEGLDIPEVNSVVFYEPIPSAIRKIQRTGRTARLSKGKLIILITKDTRDEISHYASNAREKKMYKTIHSIKHDMDHKPKTLLDFK